MTNKAVYVLPTEKSGPKLDRIFFKLLTNLERTVGIQLVIGFLTAAMDYAITTQAGSIWLHSIEYFVTMRNTIWAAIFAFVPATHSLSEEVTNVCKYFDAGNTLVPFTLRMKQEQTLVEFKVPENFIEGHGRRRDGIVTNARLFTVDADRFEPLTRQQQGDLNKAGKLNELNFLIRDYVPEADLANSIVQAATLMSDGPIDFDDYEKTNYDFDLLELQIPRTDRSQVFLGSVSQSSGLDIISCSALNGKIRVPICRHFFRSSSDVDVQASYRRTELARWTKLRENIEKFLMCSTKFNVE